MAPLISTLLTAGPALIRLFGKSKGGNIERTTETISAVLDTIQGKPSPEQVTDYRERLAVLNKIIAELPPRQKEVFLLHKFDGLTHTEISERLGISRIAVEKLIMKSLLKCRTHLGDLLDQKK